MEVRKRLGRLTRKDSLTSLRVRTKTWEGNRIARRKERAEKVFSTPCLARGSTEGVTQPNGRADMGVFKCERPQVPSA
eukprot:19758-Eustigmatos_ZCMA.PRE.1